MRNSAKLFTDNMTGPFTEILYTRCSISTDYKTNTFYLTPNPGERTWGVRFELRNGYTAQINGTNLGISHGTIDGKLAWMTVASRPLSLDYTFSIYKNRKLYDTYRVISVV